MFAGAQIATESSSLPSFPDRLPLPCRIIQEFEILTTFVPYSVLKVVSIFIRYLFGLGGWVGWVLWHETSFAFICVDFVSFYFFIGLKLYNLLLLFCFNSLEAPFATVHADRF